MLLENQNKLFGELVQQMRDQRLDDGAAVAVSPSVPLPPPLAIDGDMEENFCFFEGNWRNYATAIGMDDWPVADNPKKVSFLLSIVGTPALKKYFNFELTAADKRSSDSVLAAIKKKWCAPGTLSLIDWNSLPPYSFRRKASTNLCLA